MDAGSREDEDRSVAVHSPGAPSLSPSTPRRPLRYHNHRPQQQQEQQYQQQYQQQQHQPLQLQHHHYHAQAQAPFGQSHENGHGHDHHTHDHAYGRDPLLSPVLFQAPHHQLPTIASATAAATANASVALRAAPVIATTTTTTTATSTSAALDDSLFGSRVASNRNAAHANAVVSIEPSGFSDPDEFYRVHLDDLMASTLPVPRHNQDASLRSNGNGSVPRHPALSSTRPGVRPSVRSVSAPVEDRLPAGSARSSKPTASSTWNARTGHKPSVKDLTRKFNQSAAQTNSNVVHKIPRGSARETQWAEVNGQQLLPTGRSSASESSTGASPARSTQRRRAIPENPSGSSQSFASRIAKPRASLGTHSQASKSMTNLAPDSPAASIPPLPQSRGLLFGEVGVGELNTGVAGHGIDDLPARNIGQSSAKGTLGRRQRSFSYTDAEPSSPSDWYRDPREDPGDGSGTGTNAVHKQPHHCRSRSEMGFTKPAPQRSTTPRSSRPKPTLDTSTSKIPVSIRKYSTPSTSSSPNSTRSNSPSTIRRPFAQGKKAHASHSAGPNVPSPLASPAMKRHNRPSAITPNGNTRLNAYISTPPPKLSPTLRSSRPRQPVSAATTISSRIKAIESDKSSSKRDFKANSKGNEPSTRRRKISMGPIDYESRREQIKLSYTKSLRENEARAATKRATQERQERKKRDEEAKILAAQIAAAEALKRQEEERQLELKLEDIHDSADANTTTVIPQILPTITPDPMMESPADVESPTLGLPPLQTSSADLLLHGKIPSLPHGNTRPQEQGSPELGIPGSFPGADSPEDHDEAPPSAVSNTTEFDIEPQTEPPVQEASTTDDINENSNEIDSNSQPNYQKSEYRSPFDDESPADGGLCIEIGLDTSTNSEIIVGKTSESNDDIGTSQEVPVAYQAQAYELVPLIAPSGETKVTILGRDADFTPPVLVAQESKSSSATPEQQDPENIHNDHYGYTPLKCVENNPNPSDGEQAEPSSGLSEIAEFFVGPSFNRHREHMRSSTAGEPDASSRADVDAGSIQQDLHDLRCSLDSKSTPGTRPSLTVPRTSESMNRSSQTTVWTDYSMNSQDSSSGYVPTDQDSQRAAFIWRDALADSETDSRSESYRYSRHSMAISNSRDVSPCGTYPEPELYEPQHRLPELDTGEEFDAAILSHKKSLDSSIIPILPDHSPPPPPETAPFHDAVDSAPPSEYYDETRPSSFLHDDRDDQGLGLIDPLKPGIDLFVPSVSNAQSIDQGSLTASEGRPSVSSRLASQQTLVESINVEQTSDMPPKEKKRLYTRLEIIKELIDTETFFIRDMNIVEEIYKGTAEACPKLDDNTIKLIFRNTDKIIQFHSSFLVELKAGVSSIYTPRTRHVQRDTTTGNDGAPLSSVSTAASGQLNDDKDRETSLGPLFIRNIENMKQVHEAFLKNSDHAAKRLIQIQEDPGVQVWLNECNEVARELTRAWNLDSLLIKPMQRITKYPTLLIQLLHETPADHPDRPSLESAKTALENAIEEINKTKKNFELVGQIVGRRRKESDVKAGLARAFGKRVDKLQAASNRPPEDTEYLKLHEKFTEDFCRLQIVLRDVEEYTVKVTTYVHEFLQYLSSMELVMRLQPSPHPEIESKWVRFNVSMRDIEKIALAQHISQVRKQVIEPFELVIKSHSNPALAMKKRSKRRIDYEKYIQLQKAGKKIDKQLLEVVEQYEALNEALKKELPKLSALTEKVGKICLSNFVDLQVQWYSIWKEKVRSVLDDPQVPEIASITSTFFQDYKFQEEQINTIAIVNPASKGRPSHSTSVDEASSRFRLRPVDLSPRHRGLSLNSDIVPTLPTPDFMKRNSGHFTASSSIASVSSTSQSYRDFYSGVNGHARLPTDSPKAPEFPSASRSLAATPARPSTGQSHDSSGPTRQSVESSSQSGRYSNSAQPSPYQVPDGHRFSGIFQSALPLSDAQERHIWQSQVSSRASSRERKPINGYNVLWLAASLFEFNIQTAKHEAGYPYLTYQAGEIFDVIAEKGELWLAKNQDDPNNLVGWLWSKHFAKLAD
ncbi:hypothetical protein F4777DRAFT_552025 [Nemania sp. FL0916]|nr:hypothetical protein F4777DRAFT_552025 [Nemania sp. FL0916]